MAFGEFILNWWRAALEIMILAVGIYYAFRFVRGTRGAPVVTGFLVFLRPRGCSGLQVLVDKG